MVKRATSSPIKFLLVCLALASVHAAAADDTNSFPLLSIQGQTYTNAYVSKVTPAYAVILYDGGGKKFPMSNLPPFLQRRFDYDPDKAEQFQADEASKHQAARARAAAAEAKADAARGEVENITILKITSGGAPVRCLAATSSGQQEVFLNSLPPSVLDAFSKYDAAKQQLDALSNQVTTLRTDAAQLKAARGNLARAQRAQAKSVAQEESRAQEELTSFKKAFAISQKQKMQMSHVNAFSTGTAFGATPIWRFVSLTNQPN